MKFILKAIIPASAKKIYESWLSSEGHSKMTGGKAIATNKVGEKFTCWDGYISGKNILLEPFSKIMQSWRSSEFEESAENSMIEITLIEDNGNTELTLIHSNLPLKTNDYKQGWEEHYFIPMKLYFKDK